MNNKCNICAKFLTCDRKQCNRITFREAGLIDKLKIKEENRYEKQRIKNSL